MIDGDDDDDEDLLLLENEFSGSFDCKTPMISKQILEQ